MTVEKEICNAFSRSAPDYEQAAKVQREIGQRLFERLDYLKITPRYVLDLGCGGGQFTILLKKKYPKARVIGVDLAHAMLVHNKKQQRLWSKWPLVNAHMEQLPFENGQFDLIFANQVIHWSSSLPTLFKELDRVLAVNGCFMFSTLGPDTFQELKQAWAKADNYQHTNHFVDMHDIGDFLLNARFSDPVVDMEYLGIHYPSVTALIKSLQAQGVRNINKSRNPGLTGKKTWQVFQAEYDNLRTDTAKYPLTYEVVYGHAWKNPVKPAAKNKEILIPITEIFRNQNKQ